MIEKRMPHVAAILIPVAVIVFVIGGFSSLGELLLNSPRFFTPAIALAFALLVTFGAAFLSWREGKVQGR